MKPTRPTSRTFGRAPGLFVTFLLVSIVLFAGCVGDEPNVAATTEKEPAGHLEPGANHTEPLPEDIASGLQPGVVHAHNRFGMLVFEQLLSQTDNIDDSVFVSPTSIALALSMAYNGAAGETAQAMIEAMQFTGLFEDGFSRADLNEAGLALLEALDRATAHTDAGHGTGPGVQLNIANSIWYRQELQLKEAFRRENEHFYRAEIAGLDFNAPESVDTINTWVHEATQGLIPSVADRLDPDLVMMLINAVYFQGDWTTPFNPESTRNMPFWLASGEHSNVPMMYRSGRIDYYEDDFQAVRLPYGEDGRLAMYVFLPSPDEEFNEFTERFTYDTMTHTFGRFTPAQGEVRLPRMEIAYKAKLNEALQTLGMGVAFDASSADFGSILPNDTTRNVVYISDVIHQSVLKVDEEGTEAAAVTSIDVRVTSKPVYAFNFQADRPFVLVIRDDETEALLFVGAISNPGSPVHS